MRGLRRRRGRARSTPTVLAAVAIDSAVQSQIVVGNGSVAIQLTMSGGSALASISGLPVRTARPLPRLQVRDRPELTGRQQVIARAQADLAAGRSVQLFGAPGVGRRAVAHAVVHGLAAKEHQGIGLLDGDEPYSLASLYARLALQFFDEPWYDPDETLLRAAVVQADISGIVAITDCDLAPGEIERLLETFPRCAFLLTSSQQTLYADWGAAYEIDPLTREHAALLLARQLADRPDVLSAAQLDEAYRIADGQTHRLIEYACFLRGAAARPGRNPRQRAGLREQIALLISGLTDPARHTLTALAGFGVPVPDILFAPLAALDDADGIGAQLVTAGLAVSHDECYAATPDAVEFLAAERRFPEPRRTADGLLAILADGRPASEGPAVSTSSADPAALPAAAEPTAPSGPAGRFGRSLPPSVRSALPRLCLAVARALRDAADNDKASTLIRAAAPTALASGQVETWIQLVALGVKCATAADRPVDLEYFLNEQYTGSLLRGDQAAAVATFTALTALLAENPPAPGAPNVGARAIQRVAQRALQHASRAATAGNGAGAAIMVTAVVATVLVIASFVHPTASRTAQSTDPHSSVFGQNGNRPLVGIAHPAAAPIDSTAPSAPGTDCGIEFMVAPGVHYDLVITSGAVSCATAARVLAAYKADSVNWQGSGRFDYNLAGGWTCETSELLVGEQTGTGSGCQQAGDSFDTEVGNGMPAPPPAGAVVADYPVWIFSLSDAPWAAYTGVAALYPVAAEYPEIEFGPVSMADQQQYNALVQQPIMFWADRIAGEVATHNLPGSGFPVIAPGAALPGVGETTNVTSAGLLVTVRYSFTGSAAYGGDGGELLVMRTDSGAVIPQTDILTAAALTPAGLARIAAALNEQISASGRATCATSLTPSVLGTLFASLKAAHPFTGMQLGVTRDGIEFLFTPGPHTCDYGDLVVPFDQLIGLVDPQIPALAAGDTAAADRSASASPTPTPSPSAGPAGVVEAYFAAINAKQYQQAWQLGGDNLGGTYSSFARGFDQTEHDTLIIGAVQGNVISVQVTAKHNDGITRTFAGTYTVSGGVITAADLRQTS